MFILYPIYIHARIAAYSARCVKVQNVFRKYFIHDIIRVQQYNIYFKYLGIYKDHP